MNNPFIKFLQENPPVGFKVGICDVLIHWLDDEPPRLNHSTFGKPSSRKLKTWPLTNEKCYENYPPTPIKLTSQKTTIQSDRFRRICFGYKCTLEVHKLNEQIAKDLEHILITSIDFEKPKDGWYVEDGRYYKDKENGSFDYLRNL